MDAYVRGADLYIDQVFEQVGLSAAPAFEAFKQGDTPIALESIKEAIKQGITAAPLPDVEGLTPEKLDALIEVVFKLFEQFVNDNTAATVQEMVSNVLTHVKAIWSGLDSSAKKAVMLVFMGVTDPDTLLRYL